MESLVEGQNVAGEDAPAKETVGLSGLSKREDSRIWQRSRKSGMRQESQLQKPPHSDASGRWATTVGFLGVLAHQKPNAKKLRRAAQRVEQLAAKGVVPRSQKRLLNSQPVDRKVKKAETQANNNPERDFYDIWEQEKSGDPWYLQQTGKKLVKRPEKLNEKPSVLPAVEVIAAGGSYNPDFFSHQVKKQNKPPKPTNFPGSFHLFILHKKTKLQPTFQVFKKKKKKKKQQQQLFQLRSIKTSIKQQEEKTKIRQKRRKAKEEAQKAQPRRLGKLNESSVTFVSHGFVVTCFPCNVATLQPEGSVLTDRFKSLQKRNLIEPRERAKFKRRLKVKYVEKRAFREIT
uniref:Ribosome biogenesis protein NOP53 n=1 Tax=Amphilophus citrinellus TaxID=61819 RepID=A0A3Q0R0Z1_AMPCI